MDLERTALHGPNVAVWPLACAWHVEQGQGLPNWALGPGLTEGRV